MIVRYDCPGFSLITMHLAESTEVPEANIKIKYQNLTLLCLSVRISMRTGGVLRETQNGSHPVCVHLRDKLIPLSSIRVVHFSLSAYIELLSHFLMQKKKAPLCFG